ncbi:unnamed protein product, partial [Coregonus sp. 'balchen']
KPGVCPRRRWGIGICVELCSTDSDCPNDENCCYNRWELDVCRVLLPRWPVPRGREVLPDILMLRLQ